MRIDVPAKLAEYHQRFFGPAWIATLPDLAEAYLRRWRLTVDGPSMHGMCALVIPVRQADGAPAALKLQPFDPSHPGEGTALRAWAGQGTVLLLDESGDDDMPRSTVLLLERLTGDRTLSSEPDIDRAVRVIAELLTRLQAVTAPAGIPLLNDVIAGMLDTAPGCAAKLETHEGQLLRRWAGQVAELGPTPERRLLHWDLHYDNVLAGQREPWLAIDPKPLAGDPGFDLLPALHNRWEEAAATGDPARAVLRRFDLMTETLGLDRDRATAYSIARVLQNSIWDVQDGEPGLNPVQVAIAEALTARS